MKSSVKIIISIVFSILLLPVVSNAQSDKEAIRVDVIASGAEEDVYGIVELYAERMEWFVEWIRADGVNIISFFEFSLMKNYFECNQEEKTSLDECLRGELFFRIYEGDGSLDDFCVNMLQKMANHTEETARIVWTKYRYQAYRLYAELMGDDDIAADFYQSYVKLGYEGFKEQVKSRKKEGKGE